MQVLASSVQMLSPCHTGTYIHIKSFKILSKLQFLRHPLRGSLCGATQVVLESLIAEIPTQRSAEERN
jgi:hypothetical protein